MYNMQPLCNSGSGYAFTNGSTLYRFEICGNIAPLVPNLPPFVGDGTMQGQVVGSAQTNTYCNGVQRLSQHGQLLFVHRSQSQDEYVTLSLDARSNVRELTPQFLRSLSHSVLLRPDFGRTSTGKSRRHALWRLPIRRQCRRYEYAATLLYGSMRSWRHWISRSHARN